MFFPRHNFDPFPFPQHCSTFNMAVAMLGRHDAIHGAVSRWGNKLLWGYDTKQAAWFPRGSRCESARASQESTTTWMKWDPIRGSSSKVHPAKLSHHSPHQFSHHFP